jgi:hypothetical protein
LRLQQLRFQVVRVLLRPRPPCVLEQNRDQCALWIITIVDFVQLFVSRSAAIARFFNSNTFSCSNCCFKPKKVVFTREPKT